MDERQEQLVTRALAVALVVSLLSVVYVSATPEQRTDPYTEFYIVGSEGNASDYPEQLAVGESGTLRVGVSNHEHQSMQYTVVVRLGSRTIDTLTATAEIGKTWEKELSFTPKSPGQKKLQFLLYRGDEDSPSSKPYRSLFLRVTVQK